MKFKGALLALLIIGGVGMVALVAFDRPNDEGIWHPDHTRVFNGFQSGIRPITGGVSSVEPDSECKQIEDSLWRCYSRWAPVGEPGAVEILEGDVTVYDDRIVVGEVTRTPEPPG